MDGQGDGGGSGGQSPAGMRGASAGLGAAPPRCSPGTTGGAGRSGRVGAAVAPRPGRGAGRSPWKIPLSAGTGTRESRGRAQPRDASPGMPPPAATAGVLNAAGAAGPAWGLGNPGTAPGSPRSRCQPRHGRLRARARGSREAGAGRGRAGGGSLVGGNAGAGRFGGAGTPVQPLHFAHLGISAKASGHVPSSVLSSGAVSNFRFWEGMKYQALSSPLFHGRRSDLILWALLLRICLLRYSTGNVCLPWQPPRRILQPLFWK